MLGEYPFSLLIAFYFNFENHRNSCGEDKTKLLHLASTAGREDYIKYYYTIIIINYHD